MESASGVDPGDACLYCDVPVWFGVYGAADMESCRARTSRSWCMASNFGIGVLMLCAYGGGVVLGVVAYMQQQQTNTTLKQDLAVHLGLGLSLSKPLVTTTFSTPWATRVIQGVSDAHIINDDQTENSLAASPMSERPEYVETVRAIT